METAIKAARRWGYRVKGIAADRANIVVAHGNFHGRSTTIVGFSTELAYRADFGPFAPGFRHFEFGNIESLRAAIDNETCAILIEPIQGEAGIVLPPAGSLRAARELADERNVLLILDEIQSGLGRTGEWFAYMHEGIRPDGVIVGKALGGGLLPVSAFVAINTVMDLLEPGSHGLDLRRAIHCRTRRPRGAHRDRRRTACRTQPRARHASASSPAQPVIAADSCGTWTRAMGRRGVGRERFGARGC